MRNYASIILFVYNRLLHTKKTVDALCQNEFAGQSDLIVFSDGPKSYADEASVRQVRNYIATVNGFKSVQLIERERNFGLAESIIAGVTEAINRYGKAIVVEDDLLTSKYFLRYMNEALDKYQNDERVISIHAYCYPTKRKLPDAYFLRGADCWGWGTWKRGWNLLESDAQKLLREIKNRDLVNEFSWDGTSNNMKMLEDQIAGKVSSWAIRWHASAILQNKLTLFPGRSLVNNIGGDRHGTHTKSLDEFQTSVAQKPIVIRDIPIEEHPEAREAVKEFFSSTRPTLFKRLKSLF